MLKLRNFRRSLRKILFGKEITKNLMNIQNLYNEVYKLNKKIDLIMNNDLETKIKESLYLMSSDLEKRIKEHLYFFNNDLYTKAKEYYDAHFIYELHDIRSDVIANNINCYGIDSGELDILSNKYGSDKGNISKVMNHNIFPWYPHTYTKVYGILFSKIRYDVKNIFECGIGTNNENIASNMTSIGKPGASLRMWRDYFTNAIVWGGDIDRDILFSEERINTGYIDQTSEESINKFFYDSGVKEFDIIIDDGLHTYEAAASLFDSAFQYLSQNGLYIIEDLSVADIIKFQEHVSCLRNKVFVKYCIMGTPFSPDNNLIIINNNEQ